MMRYSEIPRDFSSDSVRFVEYGEEYIYHNLRDESPPSDVPSQNGSVIDELSSTLSSTSITGGKQRKDSVKSICSNNGGTLVRKSDCDNNSSKCGTISSKGTRRKNSISSACFNPPPSPSSNGTCYYNYGSTPPNKTQSLPPNASIKDYDSVILSALRVSPDELANQITLLDFSVFVNIPPDELTSCAWTKKDKNVNTPNIVAFTKRFNHTSFWTVQEILSCDLPKHRAEILTHFIKVAKKLYDLNNLHSLFAIISAMQSASIFRLKKTWACLSKKDKQTFDRLADIFSDRNNWENLREYLLSLRLPCIPYLGLFLTDLVYIDLAHPHYGGLESESRKNKMNNILRVIANYQHSDYKYIQPIKRTVKYLQSIRYIEELQNIFEEDQYKISLKLEPSSTVPSSSSCSSKESFNIDAPALACLSLSPAKTVGSVRISGGTKFVPTHRKCRSLGSKFRSTSLPRNFHQKYHFPVMMIGSGNATISNKCYKCRVFGKVNQNQMVNSQKDSPDPMNQSRHLIDDSVLEDCNNSQHADNISTESSEGATGGILAVVGHLDTNDKESPIDTLSFQGYVRRKTLLKDGRKPAVASWQRYWLQIWANSLVYFPPKSFKGSERNDFKREPCKVCPLDGWSIQESENPKHKNSFELYNPIVGTIYKFRTDCPHLTLSWMEAVRFAAQRKNDKALPVNLMSFE